MSKGAITLVTAQPLTGTPTCSQSGAVIYMSGNSLRLGAVGMTVIIR